MKTTKLGVSHCPDCSVPLNAVSDMEGDATPSPGDFGICCYCQGLHVFASDMSRRRPTEEELLDLPMVTFSRYQAALTKLNQESSLTAPSPPDPVATDV